MTVKGIKDIMYVKHLVCPSVGIQQMVIIMMIVLTFKGELFSDLTQILANGGSLELLELDSFVCEYWWTIFWIKQLFKSTKDSCHLKESYS